jgi:DnaJ domain
VLRANGGHQNYENFKILLNLTSTSICAGKAGSVLLFGPARDLRQRNSSEVPKTKHSILAANFSGSLRPTATDMRDPWTILGIQPDASEKELRDAYRATALRWHPDRNGGSDYAESRFKEANAAYEFVLASSTNRRNPAAENPWSRQNNPRHPPSTRYRNSHRNTSSAGFHAREFRKPQSRDASRRSNLGYIFSQGRGVAVGVLCAAVAFGTAICGINFLWDSVNRGKSFGDLQDRIRERNGRKS